MADALGRTMIYFGKEGLRVVTHAKRGEGLRSKLGLKRYPRKQNCDVVARVEALIPGSIRFGLRDDLLNEAVSQILAGETTWRKLKNDLPRMLRLQRRVMLPSHSSVDRFIGVDGMRLIDLKTSSVHPDCNL